MSTDELVDILAKNLQFDLGFDEDEEEHVLQLWFGNRLIDKINLPK